MLIEIKAGQFRKVSRLVRRECCNCMDATVCCSTTEKRIPVCS